MSTVVKKSIHFTLNGQPVIAPEGTVILDAAKVEGIFITNLCSSPKLKPFAACRTCMVETVVDGTKELVYSCTQPIAEFQREQLGFIRFTLPDVVFLLQFLGHDGRPFYETGGSVT